MDNHLKISGLQLIDFKNYGQLDIAFNSNFIGFTGENGEGKTNILDAIYYICTTKSYFNSVEKFNYRYDTHGMSLQAQVEKSNRDYRVHLKTQRGRKKEISVNQVKEESAVNYVGRFPIVMIAPDDNVMIYGGSAERRRVIDNVMCQSDVRYTELLIQYNKVLANRNAFLKQLAEDTSVSMDLLDTLDEMLSNLGEQIFVRRRAFIEDLKVEFQTTYNFISQGKEKIELVYVSHLRNGSLKDILMTQRQRDVYLQRTTRGVHLDDVELLLDGHPLKRVGSQGQQKTYVVSLKLALYRLLAKNKGVMPILLLDDIFEKFDNVRIRQLFSILSEIKIGQVFVTDTHVERIREVMELTQQDFEIFKVEKGHVKKEE